VHDALPSLIMLDMMMPGMNGDEFVRLLRSRYGDVVPVIVMTAERDVRRCAAEVRADNFLAKPFAVTELIAVVARCFPGRSAT